MRIEGLVLLAAFLPGEAGLCFGQDADVHTANITEVAGKLTVDDSFPTIPSFEKGGTFKWINKTSQRGLRIKFFYTNPCDPKTSRLNHMPSICNVLPNQQGTYMYEVVSKRKSAVSPSPVSLARVGSCEACRPPIGQQIVGVACDRADTAQAVPPDLTVKQGSPVIWTALGTGDPEWDLKFDKTNPCRQESITSKQRVCEVAGPAAGYNYTIHLKGCTNSGAGSLTVQ